MAGYFRFFIMFFTLSLLAGYTTASHAQSGRDVLSSASTADIKYVLNQNGMSVISENISGGFPTVIGQNAKGSRYIVSGSSCQGRQPRCRVLMFMFSTQTQFPVNTGKVNLTNLQSNFGKVSYDPAKPNIVHVTHHMVLDGGISRDNLDANFKNFIFAAGRSVTAVVN